DPVLDEASLALLQSHDADEVRLLLADNVCLLSSPFQLVDLYEYVQLGKGNIDVIRQQLHDVTNENQYYFMVFRAEYKPTIRTLSAEDCALFNQAKSGLCVAELYDKCLSNQLDFSAWLGNAIVSRIVIGATTLN
ncbi:MAG: hypothetical protein V2I33_26190, partial [Kangiellaceae bacterium]|nr:hypothetical protein [Kangiellaceae bacterium]